ncbi:chemotaxis protein CheW [Metabacillus hrfriensis]|jgi:purine-binding chemotaxis protein CheW|uniref:Chemotaxis protein CheW n=1 Tax=Metabacillus hrfriensis TaxID=3048891 RepID=A0ACD4RH54_9BACI|nr:chemotaxis protein CheW [Metabacillus sp. CT-WN-B3]UOK59559.1 chemotaxis protein CheW [Bacillus sp. OVS6]WHZ59848.1 chemotaxis protein CheW [Metabacillus sp. CT-WN-B3]
MTDTIRKQMKMIVFQLNHEEYGISVDKVRSIEKIQVITRVPGTKPFVKGVINLRGIVTPVIDLRTRFDMQQKPFSDSSRIIVAALDQYEVGLIVDAANDVIDLEMDEIEPAPEVVGAVEADYVEGVAKIDRRLIIILDLNKVLAADNALALQL